MKRFDEITLPLNRLIHHRQRPCQCPNGHDLIDVGDPIMLKGTKAATRCLAEFPQCVYKKDTFITDIRTYCSKCFFPICGGCLKAHIELGTSFPEISNKI